ncbi:hypothetical protein WME98_50080 [Sorangium sp. So ce296]|uniref:hypothetical protein n=1 Tax=Sorangium sp. So ce296 TaxID=3133296 RepID=UPI003F61F7FA
MSDDDDKKRKKGRFEHGAESVGEVLRKLLADKGIDLDTADARPRCVAGCGTVVESDGQWCAPCARADRALLRAERVKAAYASLPAWPWCRFDDPKFEAILRRAPDVLSAARAWIPSHGGLVLIGRTGIGKTAAMVAMAHRILDFARDNELPDDKTDLPRRLRLIRTSDIIRATRNHPFGAGSDAPLLRTAYEASVLMLDDLGREPPDDKTIFDMLDHRYWAGLPTVVSTNLTRAEMHARYGEAGGRRICELGRVVEHTREGR